MKKRGKQPKVAYSAVAWGHGFLSAQITPDSELNLIKLKHLSALDEFEAGRADRGHWETLVDLCNVTGEFCNQGIGPEASPWVEIAQDGLIEARNVYKLSDSCIEAIKELIDYQDIQMRCVSRHQFRQILKKLSDKIRSGSFIDVE